MFAMPLSFPLLNYVGKVSEILSNSQRLVDEPDVSFVDIAARILAERRG